MPSLLIQDVQAYNRRVRHQLPSHVDQKRLIAGLRDGDRQALAEIYRSYLALLLRVVAIHGRSHLDAEDIVQSVFLDLWKRRQTASFLKGLTAYLIRAVRNRTLNQLRHERTLDRLQHVTASRTFPESRFYDDPLERAHFAHLRERMQEVLDRMLPSQREIIELRWIRGLNEKEIAEATGLSSSAVKMQVYRTTRRLKDLLLAEIEGEIRSKK